MHSYHDDLIDFCKSLANVYYKKLEEDYNYHISDESIKETIQANEYEFYADTLEIA